jgi:hypothetical protein
MMKRDEIGYPESCLNRALATEHIFVLLARDAAAPHTVREWVRERLALGKNIRSDPEIQEALRQADAMERQREDIRSLLGKKETA